MHCTLSLLAACATSSLAAATTWTVDVNNGPGTDFTEITTAIAAVSAGDTLIVRPGQYTGFVLDKQLAIIGQGNPPTNEVLITHATILNLPANTTTVLANLYLNGFGFGGFKVQNSAGALMVDDLVTINDLEVTNCADVRFRRLDAQRGVHCTSSRVEIADSNVVGKGGGQCICCSWPTAFNGQPGVNVTGGEVHVARSAVYGGSGGASICGDTGGCDADGGAGGPGIYLSAGARLLIAGSSSDFVQGGTGGPTICVGGSEGAAGPALYVNAGCEVRHSSASLIGGVTNLGGTVTTPSPADPTLITLAPPMPGGNLTLRVQGPVGAVADILLGRRPIIVGTPQLDEERLTPVNRVFHLGPIPASGTVSMNYPVSPAWAQGFSVVFQGRLTVGGSTAIYTNSLPAILQ